jgi:cytochrome c oxidase subunit 4
MSASGHGLHPSTRTCLAVFAALIVLTGVTIAAGFIDLGPLSTPAALAIAGLKAALVGWFFMNLRAERGLTWVYAIAGLLWLAILYGLTLSDYVTRGWLSLFEG